MPADQQCLDVLLQIEIGEAVRGLRHVVQVATEIVARMSVEAAGAGMDVDVNGAHAWSPLLTK